MCYNGSENGNFHAVLPLQIGENDPMAKYERIGASEAAKRYIARLKARNKRISLLAVGACATVLAAALLILGLTVVLREEKDDGKILPNVYVAGTNLGGMTREEAGNALRLLLGNSLSTQNMVITLPDDQLVLAPEYTQAFVEIDNLIDAAYSYGRSGTKLENKYIRIKAEKQSYVLPLLDYMYLDLGYVREAVEDFCDNYSSVMAQSTVSLTGIRPDYRTIIADGIPLSSVKHQTLVITIGTPQFVLDSEVLYNEILDAYSLFNLSFSYEAPIAQEPDPLDVQELFDRYCDNPEDAHLDSNTFELTPEVYGYGFDVTEVARLINRADYGDVITVTLDFLYPDITEEDLNVNYFQDVLASFKSMGDGKANANRDVNLQLACAAINGTILKSGESFDFNLLLGPRTVNNGYKSAPTYSGSSTNTIGGGISQVASALRYCVMLAGLQLDEYHTHTYAVPYAPLGADASITYGSENLVFTNNLADPIQIFASVDSGVVDVRIVGTEEKDYLLMLEFDIKEILEPEVEYQYMTKDNVYGYQDGYELQPGITGCIVEVYICRVDPDTGRLLSSELIDTCTYERRNQVFVRIETGEGETDFSGLE